MDCAGTRRNGAFEAVFRIGFDNRREIATGIGK